MSGYLSLILVIAAAITGLCSLLERVYFRPRRHAATEALLKQNEHVSQYLVEQVKKEPGWLETLRSLFPVIFIVLIFRSFLFEPFRIPSGSMLPTLLVGDFILVNKFAYGLRLPVLNNKVVDIGLPERGDVAVFRYPEDPRQDYIKRVIGLPGDIIAVRNKRLYINGELVQTEPLGAYVSGRSTLKRQRELLFDAPHDILLNIRKPGQSERWQVPEGHYFVMGDNRDNSSDSRVWKYVPEENLVGKAVLIWMSWDGDSGRLLPFNWERFGTVIR